MKKTYPRESGRLFCRQSEPSVEKNTRRDIKSGFNFHKLPCRHIAIVSIIGGADNLMSGLNAGYEEESRKEDEHKEKNVKRIFSFFLLRRVFPPSRFSFVASGNTRLRR